MNEKMNELIKRYQDRLDNLLKEHNVSDVMDIDKVVHREEGRILRDIIKDLSEPQNKEKNKNIMGKRKVVDVGVMSRGLFMIDEDPKECDFCDEKKVCASINTITIDVICICENCLQLFINAFHTPQLKAKMPTVEEGIVYCAELLLERKGLINIPTAYAFGFKDCLNWILEILEDKGDKKDWICKDCNGVFFGEKITCTCGHGIYKDMDGETLRHWIIDNKERFGHHVPADFSHKDMTDFALHILKSKTPNKVYKAWHDTMNKRVYVMGYFEDKEDAEKSISNINNNGSSPPKGVSEINIIPKQ